MHSARGQYVQMPESLNQEIHRVMYECTNYVHHLPFLNRIVRF